MMHTLSALVPGFLRHQARSYHHRRQIVRGTFRSPEPEWDRLGEWVQPGDTALDIGANVGHYSCRLSGLVGPMGRVFSFEPIPETFAALAGNARTFPHRNVTLLNAAVGDETGLLGFTVPTGRDGSYLAHVDANSALQCFTIAVDELHLPGRVGFIKIDAEGHEPHVLAGLAKLIARDRPVVLLERNSRACATLEAWGYTITTGPTRTPNVVALPC